MTDGNEPLMLLAQGRIAEAEAECERRLEACPTDLVALNVVALAALRQGQARRARELLERAAQLAPQDGATLHHLGRAREASGDPAAALAADQAAVRAAPGHFVARLHYAAGLELQGNSEAALLQYTRALKDAQAGGNWSDAPSTPVALRPLVERAVVAVRRGRLESTDRLLAPLVKRYGRSGLDRVEAAIRIYNGEQQPTYGDARQRPTFFYIPRLPTSAYLDRRLFAWIPAYEAAYAQIRTELSDLMATERGSERVFDSDELEKEHLRGLNVAPSWDGYYFFRHGLRRNENCSACPITARALDSIELIRIRDHGPEVLFSVFTPGTHLLPHRGVTNARAVSHLPLIVPEDCALNVGGELHAWREGRAVVFDDTFEHEAWNRSGSVRVVLIADVWNPYLTDVERAAVTDVITAIGDSRVAVENG